MILVISKESTTKIYKLFYTLQDAKVYINSLCHTKDVFRNLKDIVEGTVYRIENNNLSISIRNIKPESTLMPNNIESVYGC